MNSRLKSTLAVVLACALLFAPVVPALAQGPCSVFRSWVTGDSLTASDLSTSFSTIGVTNMEFSCL